MIDLDLLPISPQLSEPTQEELPAQAPTAIEDVEAAPTPSTDATAAPEEWQSLYARWCTWFFESFMRIGYEGEDPDTLPDAMKAADAKQARLASDVRSRNAWLAVLAGVLFVGGAFVLGRRASRA